MSALSNQIEAGRAYIAIRLDKAALINGLADVGKRMRAFGASVQSFGSDMMRLSLVGAVPVAAAVNSFIKFDDQMRITGAIAGTTNEQMKALTEQARLLGSTTAFTAQQVASGMTALARLGNNSEKISKAIEHIMYLTRATGNEMWRLGEIAELTGNIMNQYGIKIDDIARVTDILTFGANRAAQTVQDIGQAMRSVGGLANQLNESIEDTVTSMIILSNRGIKGELLGTALRKAYDGIISNDKALRQLGVRTRDTMGNLRKPFMIIAEIFDVLSKKTTAEQVKIAKEIFGLRGMLAGLSLGRNADEAREIRVLLNRIHGLAKNTANQMESGIGGAFRRLVSMAQEFGLAIGEATQKPLVSLMQEVTNIIASIRDFVRENKALVQAFVALSAAGATAGAAIMALGLAIKVISVPLSALSGILAAFKVSAIVAFNVIITPVKALHVAVSLLNIAWKSLMASTKFTTVIMRGISVAVSTINGVVKTASLAMKGLSMVFAFSAKSLVVFRNALIGLKTAFNVVKFGVGSIRILAGAFSAIVKGVFGFNAVLAVTTRLFSLQLNIFKTAANIPNIVHRLTTSFINLASSMTKLPALFASVIKFAKSIPSMVTPLIERGIVAVIKGFGRAGDVLRNFSSNVLTSLYASIIKVSKLLSHPFKSTFGLLNSLKKAFSAAAKVIAGGFVSISRAAKMALAASLKPLLVGIGAAAAFGLAVYGIAKAYPAVRDSAKNALKKMRGWWDENKDAIIDFGKTLYNSIQLGDVSGAFELSLAGAMKVIKNFVADVIDEFALLRPALSDIWEGVSDSIAKYLLSTLHEWKMIWQKIKHPFMSDREFFMLPEVKNIMNENNTMLKMFEQDSENRMTSAGENIVALNKKAQEIRDEANAEYEEKMNNAKGYEAMRNEVNKLQEAMQNAAAFYRERVKLDNWQGFRGSSADAYTSIGRGRMNARNQNIQQLRLQWLIKSYEKYADSIEKTFDEKLRAAASDHKLTQDEINMLNELKNKRGQLLYLSEELRQKLDSVRDNAGAMFGPEEQGGISARTLQTATSNPYFSRYGLGMISPAERTAKSLEQIQPDIRYMRNRWVNVGTIIPA